MAFLNGLVYIIDQNESFGVMNCPVQLDILCACDVAVTGTHLIDPPEHEPLTIIDTQTNDKDGIYLYTNEHCTDKLSGALCILESFALYYIS